METIKLKKTKTNTRTGILTRDENTRFGTGNSVIFWPCIENPERGSDGEWCGDDGNFIMGWTAHDFMALYPGCIPRAGRKKLVRIEIPEHTVSAKPMVGDETCFENRRA